MYNSKPRLGISLKNLRYNYELLKRICYSSEVGAVVKANAYGLGINKIALILLKSGCSNFFVSNREEAILLRSIIAPQAKIYVLLGVCSSCEVQDFLQYNLIPVINNLEQIEIWKRYGNKLPCVLHIDTGMRRLGLSELEIVSPDVVSKIEGLNILYIMSHLTDAENHKSTFNKKQLELFKKLSNKFNDIPKSLANSSSIFLGSEYHFNLTRPGAALYGINPTPYLDKSIVKPVVSLSAPIVQINSLRAGESVGYNNTYTNSNSHSCLIATIPVGYADGFFRSFSNKGKVFVGQYEAPIIGRVSMDLTIIDVSNIPSDLLYLGQTVEIFGKNLTTDQAVKLCNSNGYEILTSLGSRYEKIYSG